MSLKNRVNKALSNEQLKRFNKSLWLYRSQGVLIVTMPLVMLAALYAVSNGHPSLTVLIASAIAMLAIVALRYLVGAPGLRTMFDTSINSGLNTRSSVVNHLTQLPLGSFSKLHSGKVAQTLSEDVMMLEMYISHVRSNSQMDQVYMFSLFVVVLILNPVMALTALITFLVGASILKYFQKKILMTGLSFRSSGLALASKHVLEFAEGMPIIRAFGDTAEAERDYNKSVEVLRNGFLKAIKRNVPFVTAYNGFAMISVGAGVAVAIMMLPEAAKVTDIQFIGAIVFLTAVLVPARGMVGHIGITTIAEVAEKNLSEIEQLKPLTSGSISEIPNNPEIRFENVNFAYEEQNVLHDINFVAKPKSLTAIVGGSGAGKTTLMNLLLRFWDIKEGEIKLNNTNIKEFAIDSYMNRMAVVFQETQLFQDSIANNIRIGNPQASMEEIIHAAKQARIHDRIMELKDGYDTVVGQGGSTLSGGERQRVTIARALLKDAEIIILDEATSALDPENEHEVQMAFAALAENKTVFVIAHRLSTIVNANNILVLDNGKISAQGTHAELHEHCEVYQNLWRNYQSISEWKL